MYEGMDGCIASPRRERWEKEKKKGRLDSRSSGGGRAKKKKEEGPKRTRDSSYRDLRSSDSLHSCRQILLRCGEIPILRSILNRFLIRCIVCLSVCAAYCGRNKFQEAFRSVVAELIVPLSFSFLWCSGADYLLQ